jgi:hypothetical protein
MTALPPRSSRPPDLEGPYGVAWNVGDTEPGNLAQTASVAAWIVHLPASHPLWPTYLFGAISLAPIEGVRPPALTYPEAEFEFLILALDPTNPIDVDDRETWHYLSPVNVVVQFDYAPTIDPAEKRRLAVDTTRLGAFAAVRGAMGVEPDDDSRVRPWWTDAIRNSTDHALGLHDGNPQ